MNNNTLVKVDVLPVVNSYWSSHQYWGNDFMSDGTQDNECEQTNSI